MNAVLTDKNTDGRDVNKIKHEIRRNGYRRLDY